MLNERNKANKAKKAKWEDERDEAATQGIEAADADRERPSQRKHADRTGDHPHGSRGDNRGGKKSKGAKSPIKGHLARAVKRTKSPEGKRSRAKEIMKKNLESHTVYQDMGYLMAESLGLVFEGTRRDTYGGTGPDRMAKTPFKRKDSDSGPSSKEALKKDLATRRSKGKGFIGKGDSADNTIAVDRAAPLTPQQKKARATFKLKQQSDRAKAAKKPLPKVIKKKK